MKRLIAILFVLVNSLAIFAQKDVTKFLGFPIDGTISEMKAKLKTKGFKPISSSDELEGEFNGFKAYVMPMENKGKVWRICVINQTPTNETDIRIRFNNLVRQFSKNTKYLPLKEDQYISEDENISFNMQVKHKRYEANFTQLPSDSSLILKYAHQCVLAKYTEEQIQSPKPKEKTDMTNISVEAIKDFLDKRSVWFMIIENFNQYNIAIYYENGYNMEDGEDL